MHEYQHLLLTVDIDKLSISMLKQSIVLTEYFKARLSVIYVIPQTLEQEIFENDNRCEVMQYKLAQLCHWLVIPMFDRYIRRGTVGPQICKLASQISADAILIGLNNTHQISSKPLGGIAKAILQHADCDVLTVRYTQND